jgi:hypothetical protein
VFHFKTSDPQPAVSDLQEMLSCDRSRDPDNAIPSEPPESRDSDHQKGVADTWRWESDPPTPEPEEFEDDYDSNVWKRDCRHEVCEHPSCPKTIASITRDMVTAVETNQLEVSHPSCECRCTKTSQMMRDTERMLGRKFDLDEKKDFMRRIQTEYFDPPNRTVEPRTRIVPAGCTESFPGWRTTLPRCPACRGCGWPL